MSAIAIVSENSPVEAVHKLSENFTIIKMPPDPLLDPPVAHHPDMLITILDGKLFCHQTYYRLAHTIIDKMVYLCKLQLVCTAAPRSAKYPLDVGLNTLLLPDQKKLIARRASLAPELLPYLAVDTKQGYAGCASLFIGGTVVTADPSICCSGKKIDIPVYKIPSGGIQLPGYDTGFIGGCGGVWENTVYLYGQASSSSAGRALAVYCRKRGFSIIELWDGPLSDFGGIQFAEIVK